MTTQQIRIAVTGTRGVPASHGGVEHHCEALYSRLAKKGYDITIYVRRPYVKQPIKQYKKMRIRRLYSPKTSGLEAFVHTFWSLLHVLVDRPDIVHIHAQGPAIFSWMPRLLAPGTKVFFTCHGLDWQRKKWSRAAATVIRLGERASAVFPHYRITVSKTLRNEYTKRLGVKAHYIPNGVDLPAADQGRDQIEALGLEPGTYFLFVARIVPEKRIEDLIAAFFSHPRVTRLVIVGDAAGAPGYLNQLKIQAANNPAVCFVGYQFGETLAQLFANARGFISASELEGLPITLLEALSYGLPCLASDIAPHREVLEAIDGFLFPVGDRAALARGMDQLEKAGADTLAAFGAKAKKIITDHYNWDRVAEAHHRLYQESLKRRDQGFLSKSRRIFDKDSRGQGII